MTIGDREALFGTPSESLAAEAVWLYHDTYGAWPLWDETVEWIVDLADCDAQEAAARLAGAVQAEEVEVRLFSRAMTFTVHLTEPAYDRVTRLWMETHLKRRNEEDIWAD